MIVEYFTACFIETNLGGPLLNSPCPRGFSPSSRLRLLLRSSLDSLENLTLRSPPLVLGWIDFFSTKILT